MSKTPASSERTKKLFQKLAKITRDTSSSASPDDVHDLRTTARRIETLLSTHGLDNCGATAKLSSQLAKLRRRAGKLRDIDVHLDALGGLQLQRGTPDKTVLHKHLSKRRSEAERRLLKTLDKQLSKGLARRMKRATNDLQSRIDDVPEPDYTAQALAKFKTLVDASPRLTEKTLHDFRIDCKRIRYLAEMSGDTPLAEQVVSSLKSIQDAIGDWHDWLTLADEAKQVVSNSASPMIAALRAQTRSKFKEALRVTTETTQKLLAIKPTAPQPSKVSSKQAGAIRRNRKPRSNRGTPPVSKMRGLTV